MKSRQSHNGHTASPAFTITFDPMPTAVFRVTVGQHPPETFALLGGDPADRFRVTDLRFLPATRGPDGKENLSTSHVEPDNDYVWHILKNEWLPTGKTILGYIHSHPGRMTSLSRGTPGSGVGDVASIKAELQALNDAGIPFPHALMPIATQTGRDRQPEVTGWVVTVDDPDPLPAEVIFLEEDALMPHAPLPAISIIDDVINQLSIYQDRINRIWDDQQSPEEDRRYATDLIRRVRAQDMAVVETEAVAKLIARYEHGHVTRLCAL